jgi:acetyltransferase/esterase
VWAIAMTTRSSEQEQEAFMEKHMENPVMEMLPVPGARLHTETRGSGPLLVFIVGGNGDAEAFGQIAAVLARQFTVVTYDRRGFARSPLDGPVDDAARLALDAEDAARVIEHHGGGPAYVFGSSSGAIVGLDLLARHPARVRTMVAHEPPLVTLLPDAATWLALFDDVHATYLTSGVAPAMVKFAAGVGMPLPRQPPAGMQLPPGIAAMLTRMPANQTFWLAHELPRYPRFVPDMGALRAVAGQLVLGVGREPPDAMLTRPARVLAESLHVPVVEFSGGHVGYVTNPAEFAPQLAKLLA